jgi:hypothetical protein
LNGTLQVIPRSHCRNQQLGDWQVSPTGSITVSAAAMDSLESETLIQIHELIESILCVKAGITDAQVTAWDEAHQDHDEPGSLRGCPYRKQHATAMEVERIVCVAMGIRWADHEKLLAAADRALR